MREGGRNLAPKIDKPWRNFLLLLNDCEAFVRSLGLSGSLPPWTTRLEDLTPKWAPAGSKPSCVEDFLNRPDLDRVKEEHHQARQAQALRAHGLAVRTRTLDPQACPVVALQLWAVRERMHLLHRPVERRVKRGEFGLRVRMARGRRMSRREARQRESRAWAWLDAHELTTMLNVAIALGVHSNDIGIILDDASEILESVVRAGRFPTGDEINEAPLAVCAACATVFIRDASRVRIDGKLRTRAKPAQRSCAACSRLPERLRRRFAAPRRHLDRVLKGVTNLAEDRQG